MKTRQKGILFFAVVAGIMLSSGITIAVNPGQWFAKKFTEKLNAEKTLVQKSGYFARSAAPNNEDLDLIRSSGKLAAEMALDGQSGVVGLDEENKEELGLIDFEKIKGGKPFDYSQNWYNNLLNEIGQEK